MKKVLVVIVALILVLAFFGCSKDDTTSAKQDTETVETTETAGEEEEPSEEAGSEADSGSDSGVLSPDFKKTMDDYEAWFDHYCDVMKKYEEDPSDLELLSEMSDLLTEETKMLDEMENMDQSEMNTAELAYYLEVTARIEKKLLEVAY